MYHGNSSLSVLTRSFHPLFVSSVAWRFTLMVYNGVQHSVPQAPLIINMSHILCPTTFPEHHNQHQSSQLTPRSTQDAKSQAQSQLLRSTRRSQIMVRPLPTTLAPSVSIRKRLLSTSSTHSHYCSTCTPSSLAPGSCSDGKTCPLLRSLGESGVLADFTEEWESHAVRKNRQYERVVGIWRSAGLRRVSPWSRS
jgi:hypothetical protein